MAPLPQMTSKGTVILLNIPTRMRKILQFCRKKYSYLIKHLSFRLNRYKPTSGPLAACNSLYFHVFNFKKNGFN